MNKREIREHYSSTAKELEEKARGLRRRSKTLVAAELITFIAAIGFVAAYTAVDGGLLMLAVAAILLIAYLAARQYDVTVCEETDHLDRLCRVYRYEIAYLNANYHVFEAGIIYADPNHPFTFDMDIFGTDSLYNRICRTVTSGGGEYLAQCLASPLAEGNTNAAEIDFIKRRREAIRRLATMERQRAEFMASGSSVDTFAIKDMIGKTREIKVPAWASSAAVLAVAWLSMGIFVLLTGMAVFTDMPAAIALIWGSLHLFGVGITCSRPLRDVRKALNRLHKQTKWCVRLVRLIVSTEMYDIGDPALRDMDGDKEKAEKAFGELDRILDGLDRSSSFLGQLVFNVFSLTDFFIMRRFAIWQRDCLDDIGTWTDNLAVMDTLVSMATFRYNEPDGKDAELSDADEVRYDARGIYHPFLAGRAVSNDFTITDSNYYIITGANMAGKSTFLRTMGINYILALCGMPVFADSMTVTIFNLFTSMRTTDNLSYGISYFNAELLRLDQLLESVAKTKRKTLIILDEILKGTNSADKLNGSRMFLEAVAQLPVSGIIATHDLELSKMADEHPGRFHNYCFEISLDSEITYTYKITQGVARNQNATYLLRDVLKKKGLCP